MRNRILNLVNQLCNECIFKANLCGLFCIFFQLLLSVSLPFVNGIEIRNFLDEIVCQFRNFFLADGVNLALEDCFLARIIGHLVIFWECNSYIEIFVNLVTCNLFFKARDKLTAAQLQLEVFALAAFKRRIAKETFKVEGHFVAHFCCTVVHRNHLCISLANIFSLLCNIFICDFLVFLRSSHALVVSDVDFRLGHANNLYSCTVFLANRSHFYLRSIDQIQSSFCNDTRHFHIQNQVQSIFKEHAFAIRSFTQSSRNFALPETRQRNVLLLTLINGFNSLFKSFCINSSDQFGHVDICFFR